MWSRALPPTKATYCSMVSLGGGWTQGNLIFKEREKRGEEKNIFENQIESEKNGGGIKNGEDHELRMKKRTRIRIGWNSSSSRNSTNL